MFFIGQHLKHVHMTYLLLNFWSSFAWNLFLTTPKKYCMWIQTSWETNHEIPIINLFLILMLKKPVFLNVKLKLLSFLFFFFFFLSVFFFLSRTFTIHRTAGEGGGYLFNSSPPLPPLHRHLDISRAVTAESSPLHISSRTRTRNLRFSSASR